MQTEPAAAAPAAPAADAYVDVASSHSISDAERTALAQATEEPSPAAASAAPDAAAVPAADAAAAAPAAAAAAAAEPPAVAVDTPAAPPPTAPADAPAPPLVLLAVPEAPKDFDAEFRAISEKLESGMLDAGEYESAFRALTVEQARFEGSKASIEAANKARTDDYMAAQQSSFEAASTAWVAANQKFMANPLRAEALQRSIALVDQQTKGALSAAALLQRAEKITFDAYGWDPVAQGDRPAPTPANDGAAAAAAIAARKPNAEIPPTLSAVPSAGNDGARSSFNPEGQGIQEVERAVAGMSAAQLDAWLREVDSPLE